MTSYLEKTIAERKERLARMQGPQAARAAAGSLGPENRPTEPPAATPTGETAVLLLRIDALERQTAASASRQPPAAAPQVRTCDIKAAVAHQYGLTPADLEGRSQRAPIARARHIAIYLARELTGTSFTNIARQFGNRRHAGAVKPHAKIERLRTIHAQVDRELRSLSEQICSPPTPSAPTGGRQDKHLDAGTQAPGQK
jgi:hypothetical protein